MMPSPTGIRHSGRHLGIADPMHAALDDRMFYSEQLGYPRSHIDFPFPGLHRHNPRIVSFENTPVKITLIRFPHGVGGPA
jgi:hypothetical protein